MAFPAHPPPRSYLDRHRQLAPTASMRVSPLCLGATNFGDSHKEHMGECTKETAFEILDYFTSQGGNFIDTANGYQNGESEIWLGEWLTLRKNRDEIVLAAKYSTTYKSHEKGKIQSNYGGNGTKSLRVSAEESLKKLQTSYIDLLYLHVRIPREFVSAFPSLTSHWVSWNVLNSTPPLYRSLTLTR
jgi:aryl-alcohol dehydrogenase-like predicted oxidoreductase